MIRRYAFTLIELLVVVLVIALISGMIFSTVWRRDERRVATQGAATELAATMRQARALAMDRNAIVAVCFNLANAPGSSGWTLNNRAGGHWYRILGPSQSNTAVGTSGNYSVAQSGHYPVPDRYEQNGKVMAISRYLESVDAAWYGEAHVLPAGKARFVALGDQDNGPRTMGYGPIAQYSHNTDVANDWRYPRPWFGRWSETDKRIYPWGGYHPDFRINDGLMPFFVNAPYRRGGSAGPQSPTGFHFEGNDGIITGCVNPSDRLVLEDSDGDNLGDTLTFPLWRKDAVRPLLDARWLDAFIEFRPDGTARWGDPLLLRRTLSDPYGPAYSEQSGKITQPGPGDRTHLVDSTYFYNPFFIPEYSHYDVHTGAFGVTIGGDIPLQNDDGRYATAEEAVNALLPAFRVQVSKSGEVTIREITRREPAGTVWEPTFQGDAPWRDRTLVQERYRFGWLCQPDFTPVGRPVVDVLTPGMLRSGVWWKQP